MEDQRIYVVVADTVQHPLVASLMETIREGDLLKLQRDPEATRTILQPAGRCAAQVGHVVSKVRVAMIKQYIRNSINRSDRLLLKKLRKADQMFWETACEPYTTIVLAARDSFELNHVYNLLLESGIPVYDFLDENPEAYGPGQVRTAVATVPVEPIAVDGILDYLPLWWRE
jgi:hypothetical protein